MARFDKASGSRLTTSVGAAIAAIAEQATRRALEKNIVKLIVFENSGTGAGIQARGGTRADLYTYNHKSCEHSVLRTNLVTQETKLEA